MDDRSNREPAGGGTRATDTVTEHLHRLLIDAVDAYAVHLLDPEGRILGWNRGAERLGGFRPQEMLGRHFSVLFTDEDRAAGLPQRLLERAEAEGSGTDEGVRRRDGGRSYVGNIVVTAARDEAGRLLGFSAITREITEERERQEDRSRSERRFRAVFEDAPAIYIIVDPRGEILAINRFGAEYLGYTPDRLVGRSVLDLVHEADRDDVASQLRASTGRVGAVLRWEFRKVRKDGSEIWVREMVRPMRYPGEEPVIFLVCDDVSDKKAAEDALRESEGRYRLLLELLPQYVWTADPGGRNLWFSERWFEFTGSTPEEVAGDGWMDLLHPDDRERTVNRWRRSVRTGDPYSCEHRFRDRSGEYRWFLAQAAPQRDEAGDIVRWVGTLTDIELQKGQEEETEELLRRERQARAEAELRAREERALRDAVGNVSAALGTEAVIKLIADTAIDATSSDGALVSWIRGDSEGEGPNVETVSLAGEVPPHRAVMPYRESYTRMAVDHGRPLLVSRLSESEAPLWGGRLPSPYRDWSMLVVPLYGADHAIGSMLLLRKPEKPVFSEKEVARANTFAELAALAFRRLDLMEVAQRRTDELELITESRTRLMRGFSHDLKNPLGAADGHAQLLEDGILGELSERQKESVGRIRRSIQSALKLIRDLMELARAESGQVEIEPARIDLAPVARETAADFEAHAVASGTTLDVDAPDGLETVTDAARVRQILENLLSNAVKYAEGGRVDVAARRTRGDCPIPAKECVAIAVSDTGPGIPADQFENVFHEFTRLNPDLPHGTGVGLAISRHVARLLGGDITLESELGRGSTFTLWLPVRSEVPAPPGDRTEKGHSSGAAARDGSGERGDGGPDRGRDSTDA